MSYVVSLNNVVPPARFDGNPWTKVKVYEGEVQKDTYLGEEDFTEIDEVELSSLPGGVDSEPEHPRPRSITTNKAELVEGWYYLLWEDASEAQSGPSRPVQNVIAVESSVRPTLSELGTLMRSRTVEEGTGGTEAGTFNEGTRPTGVEAEALITQATAQTLLVTGSEIAPEHWDRARVVALYLAAQLIELGYYREDIERDQSAFPMYEKLHKESLDGLIASIRGVTAGSPTQGFCSVPIVNRNQARFRALLQAIDPKTGRIDPSKLPADMDWPMGPGGLPPWFLESVNAWPNMLDLGWWGAGSDSFLDEY